MNVQPVEHALKQSDIAFSVSKSQNDVKVSEQKTESQSKQEISPEKKQELISKYAGREVSQKEIKENENNLAAKDFEYSVSEAGQEWTSSAHNINMSISAAAYQLYQKSTEEQPSDKEEHKSDVMRVKKSSESANVK